VKQPPAGDAEAIISAIERDGQQPLRAMIEIADRCNEVCVHCYQEQGRKGEMDTAQLKAVIDELAEMGILVLTISGGEATLRRDFLEIMGHARDRGFVLRLFTNGLTMTRQLAEALHELAVDVVEISLYSHRAEVHDFVTGVPGSFERTVAGIRHLREVGVAVHVKTNVMRVNEDELDDYVRFAESLDVTYAFDPDVLSPREYESLEPAVLDRSAEAARRLRSDPRFGSEPRLAKIPLEQRPLCGAGESILIEPNGDVRPCVVLPMSLGSATEAGGVRGSRQSEVRQQLSSLRWADVHGCRDCVLSPHCHRCHAQALAEVGDALAPYPSACDSARDHYARFEELAHVRVRGERGLGPYRLVSHGQLEEIAHRITAEDDARAARMGWVRRAEGAMPLPEAQVRPGQLVQLRRPGARRARPLEVPGADRDVPRTVPTPTPSPTSSMADRRN
jgi:radical SAM protein with 4Fe4S-binding SPASM domain